MEKYTGKLIVLYADFLTLKVMDSNKRYVIYKEGQKFKTYGEILETKISRLLIWSAVMVENISEERINDVVDYWAKTANLAFGKFASNYDFEVYDVVDYTNDDISKFRIASNEMNSVWNKYDDNFIKSQVSPMKKKKEE